MYPMSQTDTEPEAVGIKPFPAIRRELPKHHPEHPETMDDIQQSIDKPLPIPTLTKVSIVIPVYNEEATVQELVVAGGQCAPSRRPAARDHLRQRLLEGRHRRQARRAARALPRAPIQIIHKPVNEGKGAALRDGFKHATGDVVLDPGCRSRIRPGRLPEADQPIVEDKADVVYGSGSSASRIACCISGTRWATSS